MKEKKMKMTAYPREVRAAAAAAVSLHFIASTSCKICIIQFVFVFYSAIPVVIMMEVVLHLIAIRCERILVVAFAEVGASQVSMGSTFPCKADQFFASTLASLLH